MKGDDHLEQLLDRALEATFPASDPIALSFTFYPSEPRRKQPHDETPHDGRRAARDDRDPSPERRR
jgi:hypothetical protein